MVGRQTRGVHTPDHDRLIGLRSEWVRNLGVPEHLREGLSRRITEDPGGLPAAIQSVVDHHIDVVDAVVFRRIEPILIEGRELAPCAAPGISDESVQPAFGFLQQHLNPVSEALPVAEQVLVGHTRFVRQPRIQLEQVIHGAVEAFDLQIVSLYRVAFDTQNELVAPRGPHPSPVVSQVSKPENASLVMSVRNWTYRP